MRPWFGEAEAEAVRDAVLSGWVAQGPRVAAFEKALAGRLEARAGVALSNCTTALHLGLVLAGVGPGDEVVVPSLSFIATANVVRHQQAVPVFADVDLHTQNLTVETVERALTPRTRAVIAVHQAGTPLDLDPLSDLCRDRGLVLIEDAACAIGSQYRGRPVGSQARFAAFSFHPRKLLTTGEGGMLLTDDPELAARARRLREHGMDLSAAERHQGEELVLESYTEVGFNYRMTDVQAALGLVQLERLDAMVARRRELAARYQKALPGLLTAADTADGTTNYQSFWVLLPPDWPRSRNDMLRLLLEHGISGRRGIMAAHTEPAYAGHPHAPLPVTERLAADSLILPIYHELSEADQDRIIDVFTTGGRA
ncbi:DegT/DnrJ/EryC1/StrS family aminotransferase [Kineosporia mesophila]|nr:DegT/DnrJ/EryC1/StrS family aminotransferase [Kineosporia mesophila]MCD5350982.1 DegT/DnrJ/EryC1/StrS family aminotransferase [Kineosporia mesophila]